MRALNLALLCALSACRTLPTTPQPLLDALAAKPGAYLVGTPAALSRGTVLNAEDFVYDARLSPDARSFAVARLGMKSYFLSVFALEAPPVRRADVVVNPYEFDVEMVEFSPDGQHVVTVGRDLAVRVFDAATGQARGAWLTEEPLVSVAFDAAGTRLAVGSAKGLITVLEFPSLSFVAEVRGHTDEVRGLAFAADGTLFSGGWDKRVRTWALTASSAPPRTTRVWVEKKNGLLLFRAIADAKASATVTIDTRLPLLTMKGALAQAAGIDVTSLTETVTVPTAFGPQVAKLAHDRVLSFKNLRLEHLDVAICDACIPTDATAALGQAVLERLAHLVDDATHELILTAKEGAPGVSATTPFELAARSTFTFDAAVNDLTLDARGKTLGLALSVPKAQRTRDIYEREKRGEAEPDHEWSCAARVDAATGAVLERRYGHHGVVSTAAISPDGATLASGGWDKRVLLHVGEAPEEKKFGWAVRRVRFSRDGRALSVAAWTPQNPLNDHQSDPSAVVYEVLYRAGSVSP